jgi:flagellin
MSVSVNFNPAAVRTHQGVRATDRLLTNALERLSTGTRINRAQDDPAGLVIANALRHTIGGITKATENAESGITMMQTAEGSMDQVNGLLLKLRQLTLGAANQGVNDASQLVAYQTEMDEAISSITRIAGQTNFGSINLLQGQLNGLTLDAAAKDNLASAGWDATRLPGGIKAGTAVTITPPDLAGGTGTIEGFSAVFAGNPPALTPIEGQSQGGVLLDAVNGKTFTVIGAIGSATYTLTSATTFTDLTNLVNADTQRTGAYATYDAATGSLQITNSASDQGRLTVVGQDMTSTNLGVGLLDSSQVSPANSYRMTSDNLSHERISAQLRGPGNTVPAATSTFTGLTQQVGGALNLAAGGQIVVTGPRGSQTVVMSSTTRIDQFTALVNAGSATTGVRAAYDTTTGELSLESMHFGAGALNVSSTDMTGGGVGLLDGDTSDALANPLAAPRDTYRMRFTQPGGAPATANDMIFGLEGDGTTFDVVWDKTLEQGGRLTVAGKGQQATLELAKPTLPDEVAAWIATNTTNSHWNAATRTLTVNTDINSVVTTVGSLTVTDSTTYQQFAAFVTTHATTLGVTGSTGSGVIDLTPGAAPANLGPQAVADPVALATQLGANVPHLRSTVVPGGVQLSVVDDAQPVPNTIGDPLDVDATTTAAQIAAWMADPDRLSQTRATLTAADPFPTTATVSFAAAPAASLTLEGTTLGEVVAFLNNHTTDLGISASFAAGAAAATSGATLVDGDAMATWAAANLSNVSYAAGTLAVTDGATPPATVGSLAVTGATTAAAIAAFLNSPSQQAHTAATITTAGAFPTLTANATYASEVVITGSAGPINVQSGRLNSTTNTGLFDLDTTSGTSTAQGALDSRRSTAPNPSMNLSFTDAQGIARTLRLVEIPTSSGGLTFTNLDAGPESAPPFTGWQAGAFSATFKDPTDLAAGAVITVPTTNASATRVSDIRLQTGPDAGQTVPIEVPDMRSSALGWTAMRERLGSATEADVEFLRRGLYNLQDLADNSALVNGWHSQALTVIDAAIDEVSNARGKLGATQADSVEAILETQRTQYENLTDAESRIRDVDFAQESAEYSRLNIIYQAGIAMLGQANQIPQTVLQLLK